MRDLALFELLLASTPRFISGFVHGLSVDVSVPRAMWVAMGLDDASGCRATQFDGLIRIYTTVIQSSIIHASCPVL